MRRKTHLFSKHYLWDIQDKDTIIESLSKSGSLVCDSIELELYSDCDDFADAASQNAYDMGFVTADNTNGIKGVYAAKKLFPDKQVIWFSTDNGFGVHSYRCNLAFFHEKPLTATVLEKSLAKINI